MLKETKQTGRLRGKITVVAGATRGAGRGIACMLGAEGATVYCTGRSSRSKKRRTGKDPFDLAHRPETVEETAEKVTAYGGEGIPVIVDHTREDRVKALFKRIKIEQGGLDLLVNDIWGGDELTEWSKPFWELDLKKGLLMLERAVHSHIITSRYAAPLLLERGSGLIVEMTDGEGFHYRGNLFYDLSKVSVIRLAYGMSEELRPHQIAAVAVTPGFLRSEVVLDFLGVSEANWEEGVKKDPHFIASETPFYVGRAVAALACDAHIAKKSGKVFTSWGLAEEYRLTDIDGRRPNWGQYFKENFSR